MLDTFILLVQANYLDYIDLFEAGRAKRSNWSALPLLSRRTTAGPFM